MSRYKRHALLYTYNGTFLSADGFIIETGMFTAGLLCAVIFQKSCQTEFRNLFVWFVIGIALASFLLTLVWAPELTRARRLWDIKLRSADFPTSSSFSFHWRLWCCRDVVDLLTAKEWRPVAVPSWRLKLFADAGAVYLCFGSDDVDFPYRVKVQRFLLLTSLYLSSFRG